VKLATNLSTTSADEFPVAVPLQQATADYKEKSTRSRVSREYNRRTKKIVSIIGISVLRWNEMRTLVANTKTTISKREDLSSTFRSKSILISTISIF
jgi:hypothetical protein